MARKTTNTKAAQSSDVDETAATAHANEAPEQKAEAQQEASAPKDTVGSPVPAPEAGTARPASEETKAAMPDKADDPEPEPVNAILVKGPKKGRWRAGRHFTREGVIIPLDELSEEDAAKLKADTTLTIEPLVIDEAAEE